MFSLKHLITSLLIKFMTRLIQDADRKVFPILDNLRIHHGKKVNQWLERNKEKIEIFYLNIGTEGVQITPEMSMP